MTSYGFASRGFDHSWCSEREPADSLRDRWNVIGGCLPSLTFALVAANHASLCLAFRPSDMCASSSDDPRADLKWSFWRKA